MKYLFAFLLTFKLSISTGQTVKYKCFLKTECTNSIKVFRDYILTKDKQDYKPSDGEICVLPDTGIYYLFPIAESNIGFSPVAIPVEIKEGLTIDTLPSIDLYRILIIDSDIPNANKYENWQFCGHPASGYLVDYTISGRTEGEFCKGRAVGKLKYFNKIGELTSISHCNKRGKLIKNELKPAFYKQIKK